MASPADPIWLAGRHAPSRVVFGPHETNLGRRRAFSDRHAAYYARRAAGGAGIIITETVSVHPSDWPYERAPLAADAGDGWAAVRRACAPHGTLLLAGLGHTGGQGTSAYSCAALWAPSAVADVVTREPPMTMEQEDIDAVVAGFAEAAGTAMAAGLDGVEIDAGARALLRQFHSGLTNQRDDDYGTDRLRLTREVIAAVRARIGDAAVLALRLSCDELAPWAGVTPEHAAQQVAALSGTIDLLTVVRGGPYSASAYRPDAHTPAVFNRELCRAMRDAAGGRTAVVLQGSVADPEDARTALAGGVADLVEMTRAQIADPALVAHVRAGTPERIRPCILCNQACLVRDNRNPIVSCVGEPSSGYELVEPAEEGADAVSHDVFVVGAGPAGMECARVLAGRGHRVRVAERSDRPGGALRAAAVGPGRERLALLTAWLERECRRLGVQFELGREITTADVDAVGAEGGRVVLATGSRPAPVAAEDAPGAPLRVDVLDLLTGTHDVLPAGPVAVDDPVGGPVGVGAAEWLAHAGREVALVTPDQIAGTLLARTGDLADANGRLHRAGVVRELRALVREAAAGALVLEDVWTGERRLIACAVVVDCGYRLPQDALAGERPDLPRAGDCVAPRTVLEAVLEGRRRALEAVA